MAAALSRGDYIGAEREARKLIATLESDDSRSTELADAHDALVEALILGGKAADSATLELAQSNLETKKRIEGPDSLGVARSLHILGDVYFHRAEYAKALPLHEAGLNIRAARATPDERAVADSLERLATTEMRMERYDVARQNLEKARAVRTRRASEAPLELAHSLELTAWLYRYSGEYAAAREPLERALKSRRSLTPDHPALVTTIELEGDLSLFEGDLVSAGRFWLEALALAERTLGTQHPMISALERRLAYRSDVLGNRAEEKQRLERALVIAERTRTDCDPELIGVIDLSASSMMFDGEYVEAQKRYSRTRELSERCLGPASSITAGVLFNLALLAVQMGDFSEAERLYQTAIQTWSARGASDPYVAKGLDGLAEVYEAKGSLARAQELYERALTIRRSIRPDHPDVAWTLTNLARVTAAAGNTSIALRYVTEATEIFKASGTSTEPDHLARTIEQRGDIETRRGNYASARDSFAEALVLRERVFGSQHPLTAESRLKVAAADFALGHYNDALTVARQAQEDSLDHVKFTVRYLPERRALAYAARISNALGLELSLATTAATARPADYFDAVVKSRSVVLDELAARARLVDGQGADIAAAQTKLNAARQRFANLMLRSLSEDGTSTQTTDMLNAARQEREDAEQTLADESAAFRAQRARADIGLAEIRTNLPDDTALVSFVRYDRTMMASGRESVVPSYLAFVMRSDGEPSMVPLGTQSEIDGRIANWRRQLIANAGGAGAAAERQFQQLAVQLRRLVWEPLAAHLSGIKRVFVVPDGALNLLPIGALPADDGAYLAERGPVIHYLSAERDVVRVEEGVSNRTGLLAIGGPAFADRSSFTAGSGAKPQPPTEAPVSTLAANATSEQPVRGTAPGCRGFQSMVFPALPGSRIEVEAVAKLWDQLKPGVLSAADAAQVLTGAAATEAAFKKLSPRRRILHLATHGFFLGDECGTSNVPGTRSVGGLTSAPGAAGQRSAETIENPLLLSGLALAGANERAAGSLEDEDGILTAEEVAALNLEGVEWAVLSACDTGLGKITSGEGVLGLRRAFQVAGVRTVIMSLWSVDDRAAAQWMEALYRARLQERLDTADAVQRASVTIIRDRRARGLSTHPFYWAGFVAAGDWH